MSLCPLDPSLLQPSPRCHLWIRHAPEDDHFVELTRARHILENGPTQPVSGRGTAEMVPSCRPWRTDSSLRPGS